MGTRSELRQAGTLIRFDKDVLNPFEPRLFDPDWLKAQGHHSGSSMGRHPAHFFAFGGHEMVLRAFRRGGLLGKVNRDLYLGRDPEQSRAIREFELLRWMHGRGLPVPEPIAAKVAHVGPFYRAALITRRIPRAEPMEERLRKAPLAQEVWQRVGATIAQMHALEVYHSDLNARNILMDDSNDVWLIDFDKCARRRPGPWTEANLARLKRSLVKLSGAGQGLCWSNSDWTALMAGYEAAKTVEP